MILQPSYIPWRGYFHQVARAATFVFYDDVQYDRRGWRNRNRIKTAGGPIWLTIPVFARGVQQEHTPIRDVAIDWGRGWADKHLASLVHAYARAPHFARYEPLLRAFYARRDERLADFTIDFTVALAGELGIAGTRFLRSSSLGIPGERTERLVAICRHVGADHYLTGPSAHDYIDEAHFRAAGIGLEYMRYDYPPYEQLHGAYDPQVSVLDLLFMRGPDAGRAIWS